MAAHSETQQIAKAFAIFDDDGSGKISTSELKDVLCGGENPLSSPEEVDEALSEFDRDGDGKIGLEEFTALCLSLEDAEAEELQRLVMRRVNCKSGFEMLRGYDQFADEILRYTKGKPAFEWGVVMKELWAEMDEDEREGTTEEDFATLGNWLGVKDLTSPVEFEDWVRVFSAAVTAKVFDLNKIPTLREPMLRLERARNKRERQQREWGSRNKERELERMFSIDRLRSRSGEGGGGEGRTTGGTDRIHLDFSKASDRVTLVRSSASSDITVSFTMRDDFSSQTWAGVGIGDASCSLLDESYYYSCTKGRSTGFVWEAAYLPSDATEFEIICVLNKDSTPCSRISVQVKIEDEKQDERSERSERYNRQRLAFLDRSFKDRGVRGIDFEWSRTLGGNVTTIQCTGNHGGFAHGQNPQAQLFFKSAGSRARVRVEFWWEGGDDEKNPMAIKAMMVRGPTPSFNGKRIKGSAEKGGAIFAESTYSTLHEEKVNSVDFDLDEAMGYDRERIAVRMLFSLYFPTFCGKLHFRVIPLTEHTEIMIVPLPWEDEKKSRGGPKVCDECRDILDAAVGVEALSFGKLDLSKSAILLDHDPVYDIMERCRAIGARFTDPDFRPCDDSLRLEGERKPRHAENNPNPKDRGSPWDRVGNLHDCPDVFVDGVCCEDMSQGSLGNCWFIGQLSCLGFHDDILEALIEPNRWNPEGVYSVRWFVPEKRRWYYVIVDDEIPISGSFGSCRPLYVRSRSGNGEFWMCLIEKALAKVMGAYSRLSGSIITSFGVDQGTVASALTGFSSKYLHCNYKHKPFSNEGAKACDALFKAARMAGTKRVLLTGCSLFKFNAPMRNMKGIVRGHCYAVVGAYSRDELRLLKMRNTWGSDGEWKGEFGDSSELWSSYPEVKRDLGIEKSNDGVFWMRVEDVQQTFLYILVCQSEAGASMDSSLKKLLRLESHGLE